MGKYLVSTYLNAPIDAELLTKQVNDFDIVQAQLDHEAELWQSMEGIRNLLSEIIDQNS